MKYLLLPFLFAMNIFCQNTDVPIVPTPKKIGIKSGTYELKDNLTIAINNESLRFSAEEIKSVLDEIDISSKIVVGDNGDIILSEVPDKSMRIRPQSFEQSYSLSINDDNIKITAPYAKGVFYGAMSLIQLIDKNQNKKLQQMEIEDQPDMTVRGISDDISRGQVSNLDNFKRIIKHIARYKMNVYMPYLEDMLEFQSYPTIGLNRGALTKNEVKELIEFAKQYYVEIIPIFQTLGHYENILNQDEFLKYSEFTGAASLNVSSDSTYIFLENLLKEVFEMFPSEYFHMGADESYDVGLGKSKYLVDKSDIATVHANHYKKVYDICKKYGKKVIMYGDIILDQPRILSQIPKDITIVDWHYRAQEFYPSTETFSKAGFKYYVSPTVWNFQTTFPTNVNAIPNIYYIIKSGLENGSTGMINSNWGDNGAETIKELILYGYAWSAQCAWNLNGSDLNKFNKDYFYDFFGINDSRLPLLYERFSVQLNQVLWHEIWRHPYLDWREPNWYEARLSPVNKISWMNSVLPSIKKDIDDLKPLVKKNKDHLDILYYLAELNDWYKFKLETQLALQNYKKDVSRVDINELKNNINKNIDWLDKLKDGYVKIWKEYYKEDNLNLIEKKFDRELSYFQEINKMLNNNTLLSYSPVLESRFIYVKDDTTFSNKAEFKTTINLTDSPDDAQLQLIGDTYARLYINGKYVDQVYARRSLSLFTDSKMIKVINIKNFLKKGDNEIRVEVENYNRNGAAGVNIISQIKVDDKIIKVLTTDNPSLNKWEGRTLTNKNWRNVVTKDYPYVHTAPNFETGRTSWMEK